MAAAGFLGLTAVASSADMESRPAYKAPLAPALFTPWGGFYVGGQVGASVASIELVSLDLDPSAHTHPSVPALTEDSQEAANQS